MHYATCIGKLSRKWLKPNPAGDLATAPTKLDAFGGAAKSQFADFVTRYYHADWERE